jgi:hypothetical protein
MFLQRVRKLLRNKEMSCRIVQKRVTRVRKLLRGKELLSARLRDCQDPDLGLEWAYPTPGAFCMIIKKRRLRAEHFG